MTGMTVMLTCKQSPALDRTLASLSELAHRSPELVQGFLDVGDPIAEACSIDEDLLPACRTNEVRVVLQPSKRLLDFLAAARAGDGNHV